MLKYIEGDLFKFIDEPHQFDKTFIPHVNNNVGVAGAGFVIPLYNRFPLAKELYQKSGLWLGNVTFYDGSSAIVCNMVAQDNVSTFKEDSLGRHLRYSALVESMNKVNDYIENYKFYGIKCRIVAPQFGAGIAGGNWSFIEELIKEIWQDVDVTVVKFK